MDKILIIIYLWLMPLPIVSQITEPADQPDITYEQCTKSCQIADFDCIDICIDKLF